MRAFTTKLDLTLTEDAQKQIRLPLSLGGFGLRAVNTVCAAAYWSAGVQTILDLTNRLDNDTLTSCNMEFLASMARCLYELQRKGVPTHPSRRALLPASVAELQNIYTSHVVPPRLQHAISYVISRGDFANLKSDLDPRDLARVTSLTGKGARTWLSSLLLIPDREFAIIVRLDLGLQPRDCMPTHCPFHSCGTALADDPSHYLSCFHARRYCTNVRHNPIVSVIRKHCNTAGLSAHARRDYEKSIPDLEVQFPLGGRHLVDVSITNPCAPSYMMGAARPGAAAAARERKKIRQHSALAKKSHATVVPFVCESFGTFSNRALEFISAVSCAAEDITHTCFNKGSFRTQMISDVSLCLQRGNARMILRCLRDIDNKP